jgi:hypothetical protein
MVVEASFNAYRLSVGFGKTVAPTWRYHLLNVVIVHYHLNRGGVTQVITNHLQSLHERADGLMPTRLVLLHGGSRRGFPDDPASRWPRFEVMEKVVPELEYDEGVTSEPQPHRLTCKIADSLRGAGCRPNDTVLHIHNHSLGKNLSVPSVLPELAALGYGLLLQIHDFVEDFRPINYRRLQHALSPDAPEQLATMLYPQAPRIHYAVLNGRDQRLLRDAGIESSRLHLLPNPVQSFQSLDDRPAARDRLKEKLHISFDSRYVLSPVRGIRRKNLGESLLWAAAAPPDTAFGFTLPPTNPLELPSYEHWRKVARELDLPCFFEVGADDALRLDENFAACDRVLTTSLAEGFGFVFLEPCLAGRAVVGRDLPEITDDFKHEGMTFAGLQARVSIPVEWIDRNRLIDGYERSFNSTLQAFGQPLRSRLELATGIDHGVHDGCIDFGVLTSELQEGVLRKVCRSPQALDVLRSTNPWLCESIQSRDDAFRSEAECNAGIVNRRFSISVFGDRLVSIYRSILESPSEPTAGHLMHGDRILNTFLRLDRFYPVRI